MRLLFDQYLSHNLTRSLSDIFPECVHVREIGMSKASDAEIWAYAKEDGFTIVSKDSDFQQRSLLWQSSKVYMDTNWKFISERD